VAQPAASDDRVASKTMTDARLDHRRDEAGDTTARLLHLAGLRAEVPADRMRRVRGAVLEACRVTSRRRTMRRRALAGTALLATAAALVLAIRLGTRPGQPPPSLQEPVATVERVEGNGGILRPATGAEPRRLRPDDTIRAGERVETDAVSRLALRLPDGTSLRLDRETRTRLVTPTKVALAQGAVYVDTGAESTSLEVQTSFGTVQDTGTQFEVRLGGASLRVRVRSGLVEVRRGEQLLSAGPGLDLTLGSAGVVRSTVAPDGPEWDWAESLAPRFTIEGRSLASFLEYISREQGWTLRYAEASLARQVQAIVLHGSVDGLSPTDSLAVVLATSGLRHQFENGELVVSTKELTAEAAAGRQ
jgi:ferric-dicitrate binding protein FerR (iron transport regulator)